MTVANKVTSGDRINAYELDQARLHQKLRC
jgi:hypothetical protein